jgi:ABC-2 type transport system permease protein
VRDASPGLVAARAVAVKHLRIFLRTPMEAAATLFMPVLWLVFFGLALEEVLGGRLPGVTTNYLGFLAPGLVALTAMTAALFAGATFFLEVDRGQARQYLAAPMARLEYYLGLGGAAAVKTVAQSAILLALSVPLGVAGFRWPGAALALVVIGVFAVGTFGVSAWLAEKSPSFEAFHGLLLLLNLPLLFLSDALYPLDAVPRWLAAVATANPLTHLVEVLRYLVVGEPSPLGLVVNGAVLAGFVAVGALAGARAVDRLAD